MPAFTVKRGSMHRVVHKVGNRTLLVKKDGKAVDGGGHKSKKAADRQARAINAN